MPMILRTPSPALAPFVASLWHYEDAGELAHARERILPDGTMQLLVNLHEDELRSYHGADLAHERRTRGATIAGIHAGHFAIDTAEQRSIVGISFRPGGAFPFFAPPADALRETDVELDQVWGREGALLRERLLEQPTPAARLAALEATLLARAVRPLTPDPALQIAIAALERDVPVATVGERLGLSPRRLIAAFTAQVGMTPKRFARVRRFQRVLTTLATEHPAPWAELALQCGYFDQAHLIHEFRSFSGLHPTAYAARDPGGRNHVVLD
jgi:AraC-like DNA-binding protein